MIKFFKILKITGLVLLIGSALYLLFLKSETKKSENQNDIELSEEDQVVDSNVFLNEKGTYSFEDESLIVSAQLPGEVQEVVSFGDDQIERFVSMRKEAGDLETESFPWNLDMDYKTYESDTIISYVVQGYEYTGGAHGNTFLQSFNYDKKTGKRIDVTDIASSGDSLNIFSALADKELVIEYPEGSAGTKENWSVWYSDNNSVTFIFVPYQIASYATGQQELRISATGDNQDLFKSEYFK